MKALFWFIVFPLILLFVGAGIWLIAFLFKFFIAAVMVAILVISAILLLIKALR